MAAALRRRYRPSPWPAVYSSPLRRALETARIIAGHGRRVAIEPDFRELDYGSWDDCLQRSIAASEEYRAWCEAPDRLSPPGGESAVRVAARATAAVQRCLRAHPGRDILVVTHKAVIRLLVCQTLGVPLANFRKVIACPLASMTTLTFAAGRPMLTGLADVSHLSERWRLHPDAIDATPSRSYGEVNK